MIPDKNPYNNWSGNGSATTFDFDVYIEDETQLAVYHANSKGVQTLLKFGTDYSIKFWDIRKTDTCLGGIYDNSHWIWTRQRQG